MEATELMKEYDMGTSRAKPTKKHTTTETRRSTPENSRDGGGWQTAGAKRKESIDQKLTEMSGTPTTTSAPRETGRQEQTRPMPKCGLCSDSHWLDWCDKFRNLKPDEKVDYLRNANRCLKCTRTHRTQDCRYSYSCRRCPEIHATVMHEALQDEATLLETLIEEEEGDDVQA